LNERRLTGYDQAYIIQHKIRQTRLSAEYQLVKDYQAVRQQQYDLINGLLEVLPRVDHLDEGRLGQLRDALFHADHPYLMVFVGPFSSGKSSIINALLGHADLLPTGITPTTDRITILRHGPTMQRMSGGGEADTVFYPSSLLNKVSFVDTPGLQSVMQRHEATTRNFLHRSDVVLMVMLATQAMTASNLEYLQSLKEFGKKVIILINQVDLISIEDAQTVRTYVQEQSQARLGYRPEVWLVSAERGLEAHQTAPDTLDQAMGQAIQTDAPAAATSTDSPSIGKLNPDLWRASGLWQFEDYIDKQLNDAERLRQKLQTPLQISQNVCAQALTAVRANQNVIDAYQGIGENIEQQLAASKREQEKTVRETIAEVREQFTHTAERGGTAIRQTFALSQSLLSVLRGVGELTGLGGVMRQLRGKTHIDDAFAEQKALEPLQNLPTLAEKLAPRLEGKDIQDIDNLTKYAQREIDQLPATMRNKVIGSVQAPLQYDRNVMQSVRADLARIEESARQIETRKLERALRNTLLYLGVWEILVLVFFVAVITQWNTIATQSEMLPWGLIAALLAAALLGLFVMPLAGRAHSTEFGRRLLKLQNEYAETLTRAADKQVEYGMRLRRETVAPLTRLIEAQTSIQREQLNKLQTAQQQMLQIETSLITLGKK
jgi:GTP-binding protein EngB required for normal cell division